MPRVSLPSPLNLLLKLLTKSKVDHLNFLSLKQLQKEEQTKPKVSRRKEIIKIRAEINEIEMKKTIEKINDTKSWLFEKINKIDKPLARLIKKIRDRAQINKIRNEKREVTKSFTSSYHPFFNISNRIAKVYSNLDDFSSICQKRLYILHRFCFT